MTSVKDKQRFIDRFGRDPKRVQFLFSGDADKSCEQVPQSGVEKPGNFLLVHVHVSRYSIKLQSIPPENISWVRPCLQSKIKVIICGFVKNHGNAYLKSTQRSKSAGSLLCKLS